MNPNRPPHVGLMVPINNSTAEGELLHWLPDGATCTTLRIPRGAGMLTPASLPAYMDNALALARQLEGTDVDLLVYGCTAAGFISGPAGDASLAEQLARVSGKPVVTTARSMVLSLQEIGARDIALITPYLDPVNDQLKAFLADGGIRVRRFDSFYASTTDELGHIPAEAVARLARQTMAEDCDAMFIACAQLPTAEILEELCSEFGRPVLSSNWSTTRQALLELESQPVRAG